MGSITSLGRYDNIPSFGKTKIDTLTYTYNHYRLTQVDDASAYTGAAGFPDPVKQANEYTDDGNGNELKDLNKGIDSIRYNVLNLPEKISKNDGSTVVYVYSASGNKLRKLYTAGGFTTITEYDNGIEYDNGTANITFIQTEEGRARKSGTVYLYEYDLKDHLGNTRVTLSPDPADPTQQTAKVLQENDYYAFGYGIQSMQQSVPSPKNEYLYNHKELQEETGLYDYGARFYDPVVARWTSVDPLAEKGRRWSPYVYCKNSPIIRIDPDGMVDIVRLNDGTTFDDKSVNSQAEVSKKYGAGAKDVSGQTWTTGRDGVNVHFTKDSWEYVNPIKDIPYEGTTMALQDGIRANLPMLETAKGVAIGTTMIMSGGLGAGEVGGNFLINGVGRKADFLSTLAENTSSIGKWNQLVGAAGENSIGITGTKTAIDVGGRIRIPDRLTSTTLEEVKNVKYQGFTSQLRDFYQHAQNNSLEMIIHTRSTTIISKPLQELIDNGLITHKIIPGL